jgi:phosphonate degradation associated HDIG domain protein
VTPDATARSATSVDEVLELYRRWGSEHYDEEISQTDHAIQTAALAVAEGAAGDLVAAALLHDVGHLLELESRDGRGDLPTVDLDHEAVGARYLAGLFGPGVTGPIALHVRAKRYRCAVDPAYLAGLSDGSTRSLALQGGPADADEVASFESNPGFADAVRLRSWDDGGKIDGLEVADLDHYRPLLEQLAGPGA